jgi:hypothetical protein
MFNELKRELITRFVEHDIGGIVNHHSFNFPFIKNIIKMVLFAVPTWSTNCNRIFPLNYQIEYGTARNEMLNSYSFFMWSSMEDMYVFTVFCPNYNLILSLTHQN